ncbi:MAG: efflux transporter outer membrane subunit [Myxococcales bacterium]
MSCLLSAAACSPVGPDYQRPQIQSPEQFRNQGAKETASMADTPWWEVFKDDGLKGLVNEAVQKNFDLRVAVQRVEIARAQARAAGVEILPQVSGVLAAGTGKGSLGMPSYTPPLHSTAYNAGFTLNWELDVWGRIRRSAESAHANYLASEEARRGVWLTLLGDLGVAYFSLLTLDLKANVARKNLQLRTDILQVFQDRQQGGVGSDLEVARGEANQADAQAILSDVERLISLKENEVSLLLGRPPGAIARSKALMVLAPEVPAGIPSTLLERRPDVRQAEARLMQANANIGVAKANFFPRFSLTGALGGVTNDLASMSTNTWGVYGISGGVDWLTPLLNGSKLNRALEGAKAEWEASKALYERAAFSAFKEVADALVTIQKLREQRVFRERQVNALIRAVDTSRTRFQGGTANYLDVLNAVEALLPAQLNFAQIQGDQLGALVQLYRALGGGWNALDGKAK